jgi:hypothetical protein
MYDHVTVTDLSLSVDYLFLSLSLEPYETLRMEMYYRPELNNNKIPNFSSRNFSLPLYYGNSILDLLLPL